VEDLKTPQLFRGLSQPVSWNSAAAIQGENIVLGLSNQMRVGTPPSFHQTLLVLPFEELQATELLWGKEMFK